MKRGKNVNLKVSPLVKSLYGTVDHSNFKSFFIVLRTWVMPKGESENWQSLINAFSKKVKNSVYTKLNFSSFHDNIILDVDLRASGLKRGKRSFMSIEITLYPKVKENFKSTFVRETSEKILKGIVKDCITNNNDFEFYISKKCKTKNIYD